MSDFLNYLSFESAPVVALDFSGEKILSCVAKINKSNKANFIEVVSLTEYQNIEELLEKLPRKYSSISVIPQSAEIFSFATEELSNLTWHNEVRRKGLDHKTHSINYLSLPKASLLCAIKNTTVEELKQLAKSTIVPESLAQTYCYYRNYADYLNETTALLHVSSTHAELCIFNQNTLIWLASVEFDKCSSEEKNKEILSLLITSQSEVQKNFGIDTYDHLLLSGDSAKTIIYELKSFASLVELLDPFRNNYYDFSRTLIDPKISTDGDRLAILLSSAALTLEGIGINLNHNESLDFINELRVELNIEFKESIASQISNKLGRFGAKTIPILENQKKLVVIGLILCVMLTGYRVFSYNNQLSEIESEIASQEKKSKQLEVIKNSYDEYQSRLTAIQTRVKTINDIQTKQLRVFTTLNQLNTRLPKTVNLSSTQITATSVSCYGWSRDESLVRNFMTDLNTSTVFEEVNPVFQNPEPEKVTFNFKTAYIGSVEALPLPTTVKRLETTSPITSTNNLNNPNNNPNNNLNKN